MDREERLMAYVDGELADGERAAFERELAADPALQQAVARQRALRARLSAAFDPVLEEPVPLRLALAARAANVRGAWRAPQWAALAACLVLGVAVGRGLQPSPGPVVARQGVLTVGGGLAQALDGRLASEAGAVRIGISFRSADGRWCRTFRSAADRLAGLACREPDGWTARALAAWSPQAGAYRTAASDTPPAVLAAVDAAIAGEPLDAAQERLERDRGWRP